MNGRVGMQSGIYLDTLMNLCINNILDIEDKKLLLYPC